MGEAITNLQLRSRAALKTDARTGWRWRGMGVCGGGGRPPGAKHDHDTIQSEQNSVAVSTFSSASKCQAVFAHKSLSECERS